MTRICQCTRANGTLYALILTCLVSQMLAAELECVLAQLSRAIRDARPAVVGVIAALGVSYLLTSRQLL